MRVFLGVNCLQSHQAHEALDMFATDSDVVGGIQFILHLAGSIERAVGVDFIQGMHGDNIVLIYGWPVVQICMRDAE